MGLRQRNPLIETPEHGKYLCSLAAREKKNTGTILRFYFILRAIITTKRKGNILSREGTERRTWLDVHVLSSV